MAVRGKSVGQAGAGSEASLRTCVASRRTYPPDDLIRFVVAPDGRIVPDLARRLPGRGVWVAAERGAVADAVRRNAFARSLRRRVEVGPELPDLVERLLERRAMEALSLANKAGLAITGFARIEAAISAGSVVALLHGVEAAADGAGKLDRRFIAVSSETGRAAPVVRQLTVAQLSLALGGPNVVHAALCAGGATQNFLNEASRLNRYRAGSPASHSKVAVSSAPPSDD